jgi:hypothetical protein
MPRIELEFHIFKKNVSRKYSQKCVLYMLEGLVNCDREWLRQNPSTPKLYESGVRYKREKTEHWRDIPTLILHRSGDCEDLASWRVAELREEGHKVQPFLKWRRYGDFWLYHVMVAHMGEDGKTFRLEDPSRQLGM